MCGVPVDMGDWCLTGLLPVSTQVHNMSCLSPNSLGAQSSGGEHACPGAALWLGPKEESHTMMNTFAPLSLQNLDLKDEAGPRWEGGGLLLLLGLANEGRRSPPSAWNWLF